MEVVTNKQKEKIEPGTFARSRNIRTLSSGSNAELSVARDVLCSLVEATYSLYPAQGENELPRLNRKSDPE